MPQMRNSLHISGKWEVMAKVIMIQGTMSSVGKSFLTAGLCRIFKRAGYKAAPFKSQNMALNSFVTKEGLEIGRAQAMQAEAAGIAPMSCMNPILLKPTDHMGSQVIVNGRVFADMSAQEYFSYKKKLIPEIKQAFRKLERLADIIVIEGAGSPAEVNLKENDIVNMGLANMVDAPVLLVGDIDRGGVFAQLLGTLMLLEKEEKERVKGIVINKFRGDKSLLTSGVEILEQKGKVPVAGIIPYMELSLEDEDSLTRRFEDRRRGNIDIAVIRYPRIANFTDFNVFEQMEEVSVRYVSSPAELGCPDLLFLPGSKNTIADLRWMRSNGFETAVKALAGNIPICGICGGYQMLGRQIWDPQGTEGGGYVEGMGFLPIATELQPHKVCRQVQGTIPGMDGILSALSGLTYEGYEIHMGQTAWIDSKEEEGSCPPKAAAFVCGEKDIYGTYIHGVFDRGGIAAALVGALAEKKGIAVESGKMEDYDSFKEKQYNKLADTLEEYLDMEKIYEMLTDAKLE